MVLHGEKDLANAVLFAHLQNQTTVPAAISVEYYYEV
jgi:hypothetical protein